MCSGIWETISVVMGIIDCIRFGSASCDCCLWPKGWPVAGTVNASASDLKSLLTEDVSALSWSHSCVSDETATAGISFVSGTVVVPTNWASALRSLPSLSDLSARSSRSSLSSLSGFSEDVLLAWRDFPSCACVRSFCLFWCSLCLRSDGLCFWDTFSATRSSSLSSLSLLSSLAASAASAALLASFCRLRCCRRSWEGVNVCRRDLACCGCSLVSC
mmetsp:Transcript_72878/g.170696  ORF Transcript_72878/g.170696 Transcript_72878/m.170696 type:complete len:217 (-) Transcript_72878:1267-1917(-)